MRRIGRLTILAVPLLAVAADLNFDVGLARRLCSQAGGLSAPPFEATTR